MQFLHIASNPLPLVFNPTPLILNTPPCVKLEYIGRYWEHLILRGCEGLILGERIIHAAELEPALSMQNPDPVNLFRHLVYVCTSLGGYIYIHICIYMYICIQMYYTFCREGIADITLHILM